MALGVIDEPICISDDDDKGALPKSMPQTQRNRISTFRSIYQPSKRSSVEAAADDSEVQPVPKPASFKKSVARGLTGVQSVHSRSIPKSTAEKENARLPSSQLSTSIARTTSHSHPPKPSPSNEYSRLQPNGKTTVPSLPSSSSTRIRTPQVVEHLATQHNNSNASHRSASHNTQSARATLSSIGSQRATPQNLSKTLPTHSPSDGNSVRVKSSLSAHNHGGALKPASPSDTRNELSIFERDILQTSSKTNHVLHRHANNTVINGKHQSSTASDVPASTTDTGQNGILGSVSHSTNVKRKLDAAQSPPENHKRRRVVEEPDQPTPKPPIAQKAKETGSLTQPDAPEKIASSPKQIQARSIFSNQTNGSSLSSPIDGSKPERTRAGRSSTQDSHHTVSPRHSSMLRPIKKADTPSSNHRIREISLMGKTSVEDRVPDLQRHRPIEPRESAHAAKNDPLPQERDSELVHDDSRNLSPNRISVSSIERREKPSPDSRMHTPTNDALEKSAMVTTPVSDSSPSRAPTKIAQEVIETTDKDAQSVSSREAVQTRTPVSRRSSSLVDIAHSLTAHDAIKSLRSVVEEGKLDVGMALDQIVEDVRSDQVHFVKSNLGKAHCFMDVVKADIESHTVFNTRSRIAPNGMAGARSHNPFVNLEPLEIDPSVETPACSVSVELSDNAGKKLKQIGRPRITATIWVDTELPVPYYTHCTSLKNNVAARNEKVLHYYPYFGEDVPDRVYNAFANRYHVDITNRQRKIRQGQQARRMIPYIEEFLSSLSISEEIVLYYLLQRNSSVMDEAERQKSCKEDFDRTSNRWITVLSALESRVEPTHAQLLTAAQACTTFLRKFGYSLWHVVRKHESASLSTEEETPSVSEDALNIVQKVACRVCHQHGCPYHGDYMEYSDSDREGDCDSQPSVEAKDVDWPVDCNHRRSVAIPLKLKDRSEAQDESAASRPPSRDKQTYAKLLQSVRECGNDGRKRYYPCHHPGLICSDPEAGCKCFRDGIFCEKACQCAKNCERRFRGCTCHAKGRRFCYHDGSCECYSLRRECDADLCKDCGAEKVLDPVNRHDTELQATCCQNVHVQLGIPKRTLLGKSSIHGFGVYAGEPIKKHDFVGEYKGEITLCGERHRRGDVYDIQKMSYLFILTEDQEVDSHYIGNKMRFVNHAGQSGKNGACNLEPHVVMCNMTPRIPIYALRDIAVGEELFFNYGEHYMQLLKGSKEKEVVVEEKGTRKKVRRKKSTTVRSKKTDLADFAEPEYEGFGTPQGKSKKVVPRWSGTPKKDDLPAESDAPPARLLSKRSDKIATKCVRKGPRATGDAVSKPASRGTLDDLLSELTDSEADEAIEVIGAGYDAESPRTHKGKGKQKAVESDNEDESDFEPESEEEFTPRRSQRAHKRRRFAGDSGEDVEAEEQSEVGAGESPAPVKRKRGRPRKYARI